MNEEQISKHVRIIKKIPGFLFYISSHPSEDFNTLAEDYMLILQANGKSTAGMRMNLNLLMRYYAQYKAEYNEKQRTPSTFPKDFQLDRVLTWPTRPVWAENMSVSEIDYLDHFLWQVPGLSEYLNRNLSASNLYDLVAMHQMHLNACGKNTPEINFTLETIKERFYRIMDEHADAIHYVNHSHQIDDYTLIREFIAEASEGFYIKDLRKDTCNDFAMKWLRRPNPYIANEIFLRFFRANNVNMSLHFARQAFTHIFSSPNIYWHNKESIYGCANILYVILNAIDHKGTDEFDKQYNRILTISIEALYLLLSRIIYWQDKEMVKNESYDERQLPIQVQHKLRAYRLRSSIIQRFGYRLVSEMPDCDLHMMELSDSYMAHSVAYSYKIVGKDSLFLRDAIKIFHTKCIQYNLSLEQTSERGFVMNDKLSQAIHDKYKKGKYCLSDKEISDYITFLREYFKKVAQVCVEEDKPLTYLSKDNFNPSYKADKEAIRRYLSDNNIQYFYHVTDRKQLRSIIKHQGLMSYKRCLDEGVVMPIREDMAKTRDIDARLNLEDYARVSFCNRLPKVEQRLHEGGDLVLLKISTEVALFENTEFTDIEATEMNMHHGSAFRDLQAVDIRATQLAHCDVDSRDYLKRQAEVLVKGIIPLNYILNIENPETFS